MKNRHCPPFKFILFKFEEQLLFLLIFTWTKIAILFQIEPQMSKNGLTLIMNYVRCNNTVNSNRLFFGSSFTKNGTLWYLVSFMILSHVSLYSIIPIWCSPNIMNHIHYSFYKHTFGNPDNLITQKEYLTSDTNNVIHDSCLTKFVGFKMKLRFIKVCQMLSCQK